MRLSTVYNLFLIGLLFAFLQSSYCRENSKYLFIENKGQIVDQNSELNTNCLFLYDGNGLKVQLRKDGFSYELYRKIEVLKKEDDFKKLAIQPKRFTDHNDSIDLFFNVHRVDVRFENMNIGTQIKKLESNNSYFNYYTAGLQDEGILNINSYKKIIYENVYNNINVEFEINDNGKVKFNWIIKPGENSNDIRLRYSGANSLEIKNGEILIETSQGNLNEEIPLSYYYDDHTKTAIEVNYQLLTQSDEFSIIQYKVANYNHSRTLVIDPLPNLEWGSYFGGSGDEAGNCIAIDSNNDLLISGSTTSTSNIATSGAHQTSFGGGFSDAFIAKFDSSGQLVWCTYYGGSDMESANSVAIDSQNNPVVTGYTYSDTGIATVGAQQNILNGFTDAFITKFNTSGIRLWSTYFGGNDSELAYGLSNDKQDNIIITGVTTSTSGLASSSAHQTIYGGSEDAFIAKFNSAGNLQWSTYFGGADIDRGMNLSTDSQDNIIITGGTLSANGIASSGAHQTTYGGGGTYLFSGDAFLAKFNELGSLQWASYYGGSGDDYGYDVAVDGVDNIFIVGDTESPTSISTVGSHQDSHGGAQDAFVTKFSSQGSLEWGSYFGDSGSDHGNAISIDKYNNVILGCYIIAYNFATQGAYQTSYGGGIYDNYLAKLTNSGNLEWATYYGGSGSDLSLTTAIDDKCNILVTGTTNSSSNIASLGAYQDTLGGSADAFISKFSVSGNEVWPGDANSNLIANNYDLLYIGLAYGSSGTSRASATNSWTAQSSTDWGSLFSNGVDYKHADCNGDAIINDDDTLAIYLNYGSTHNKTIGISNVNSTDPLLYLVATQDTVNAKQTATIEIYLGTSLLPVDSIYGIAFSISYDGANIDSGSVKIDFTNSWMGNKSNALSLYKDLYDEGRVELAFTRKDQQNIAGYGLIGEMSCVLEDNLSGKDTIFKSILFSISDVKALSNKESEITLSTEDDSVVAVGPSSSLIAEIIPSAYIRLFPNPAMENIQIVLPSPTPHAITISDYAGRKHLVVNTRHETDIVLNLNQLEAGTYFVEVESKYDSMKEIFKLIILK